MRDMLEANKQFTVGIASSNNTVSHTSSLNTVILVEVEHLEEDSILMRCVCFDFSP